MEDYFFFYISIHIIAVMSWMAGMLYLPRLFMYHTKAKSGSDMDEMFKVMERRLLRIIMNPAMLLTYFFGLLTAYIYGFVALGIWFHLKMLSVLLLTACHGFLAKCRKDFANGKNKYSAKFYKIINELPTILMVFIVILVVVKPFE